MQELNLDLLSDDEDVSLDIEMNMSPELEKQTTSDEPKETTKKTLVDEKTNNSVSSNDTDFSRDLDDNISDFEKRESVAKKKDNSPVESKQSSSDSELAKLYSSLAAQLKQAGVLSYNDDEKISSIEDINKLIEKQVESKLDESSKFYRKAVEKGMSSSEFLQYEQKLKQLDNITEDVLSNSDNSQLRLNIIGQDFLNRGYSKEDAIKFAKRSIDLGEDIDDAKKALENIKSFTKKELEEKIENSEKETTSISDKIKTFINSEEELVKGLKIDKNQKEQLYKQIITPVAKNDLGEPLSEYAKQMSDNPIKMRVMNEYMFMLTKGYTDFSKLSNMVESKVTNDLDKLLKTSSSILTQGMETDNESKFGLEDIKIDI